MLSVLGDEAPEMSDIYMTVDLISYAMMTIVQDNLIRATRSSLDVNTPHKGLAILFV